MRQVMPPAKHKRYREAKPDDALRKISGIALLLSVMAWNCAGRYESALQHDFAAVEQGERTWVQGPDASPTLRPNKLPDPLVAKDAVLADYLAVALRNHPEIQASFERWRASIHRISKARRLPEPQVNFAYFIQSVETRVGPQRARISLQQSFPWPSKLSAGADAASAEARAKQRQFEAQSLIVSQRVARAYWDLWQIRSTRSIHLEHLDVIRGLSESVRARLATGSASLADLQQIDLTAARLENSIRGMDDEEHAAEAQLRAVIGVQDGGLMVPTTSAPEEPALPQEDRESLLASTRAHPWIASLAFKAEASELLARREKAERYPSFMLGADWIITGEATMPAASGSAVSGSGKDAVVVGAGLRLPLWQGNYSDGIKAAQAEARAHRAEQRALVDRAVAELATALTLVHDAVRRVNLYRATLVPQAESAYDSVLGSYTVGRGTVAQTLLAQRDLLELRVELDQARADYARAWARLEEVAGREVEARSSSSHASSGYPSDHRGPTRFPEQRQNQSQKKNPTQVDSVESNHDNK